MRHPLRAAIVALFCPALLGAQDGSTVDRAFEAFWSAGSTKGAEKAAEGIIALAVPFEAVIGRLADGRSYRKGVETGEIRWATLQGGGSAHATTVIVPKTYNPLVKYPVRVYLHGTWPGPIRSRVRKVLRRSGPLARGDGSDAIDFDHPVKVVVNGKAAFEGPVQRSLATLLRHAARDNDRTMLFGAELPIAVP